MFCKPPNLHGLYQSVEEQWWWCAVLMVVGKEKFLAWPRILEKKLTNWISVVFGRAFRTRPFRRTRTQTEVRNSDTDSGSDLRNRDFPTP
jgi:hypothetical protein